MQGMIIAGEEKHYQMDARHNEIDVALIGKLTNMVRHRFQNYLMRKIKPYHVSTWAVKPNLGFVAIVPREEDVTNTSGWADIWEMSFLAPKKVYEDYLAGKNDVFVHMAQKKVLAELGTRAVILIPNEFNKIHAAVMLPGPPGPARSEVSRFRKKKANSRLPIVSPFAIFYSRCEAMVKADHPNASIDTSNIE